MNAKPLLYGFSYIEREKVMKTNIINLVPEIEEKKAEEKFLGLLDKDINNGNVKRVPDSVFARIAKIRNKAYLARERNERLEM
jgi:hypothetical protein